MLRQSIPPQPAEATVNQNIDLCINRELLLRIVQETHLLYHMEKRDRPNNMIRVLVELHQLGASQESLLLAYEKAKADAAPIRLASTIHEGNWKEYLGTSSLYGDYLLFFDQQLAILGLEETLNRYFYAIPFSIGSQLQPLVHLAFGIQHDLPQIITQALAYYATSYLDVSSILSYCQDYTPPKTRSTNLHVIDTLLFDLLRSDQRFDGKIEGNNTFHSSVKLLIKSKPDLLKTYMTAWCTATSALDLNGRLDALIHTATELRHCSSRFVQENTIDLDWFLAGGQLTDAAFAIKALLRSENDADLIHLLFLSMLCTFVVQGRPSPNDAHIVPKSSILNWESCITAVLQSSDPKSILALASLLHQTNQHEVTRLELANTLAQFVNGEGTWIKGGVGWSL